jgi:hypothetical protein
LVNFKFANIIPNEKCSKNKAFFQFAWHSASSCENYLQNALQYLLLIFDELMKNFSKEINPKSKI